MGFQLKGKPNSKPTNSAAVSKAQKPRAGCSTMIIGSAGDGKTSLAVQAATSPFIKRVMMHSFDGKTAGPLRYLPKEFHHKVHIQYCTDVPDIFAQPDPKDKFGPVGLYKFRSLGWPLFLRTLESGWDGEPGITRWGLETVYILDNSTHMSQSLERFTAQLSGREGRNLTTPQRGNIGQSLFNVLELLCKGQAFHSIVISHVKHIRLGKFVEEDDYARVANVNKNPDEEKAEPAQYLSAMKYPNFSGQATTTAAASYFDYYLAAKRSVAGSREPGLVDEDSNISLKNPGALNLTTLARFQAMRFIIDNWMKG